MYDAMRITMTHRDPQKGKRIRIRRLGKAGSRKRRDAEGQRQQVHWRTNQGEA